MKGIIILIFAIFVASSSASCPGSVSLKVEQVLGAFHEYKRSKSWSSTGKCVLDVRTPINSTHQLVEMHNYDENGKDTTATFVSTLVGKDFIGVTTDGKTIKVNALDVNEDFVIYATCDDDTEISTMAVLTREKNPCGRVRNEVEKSLAKIKAKKPTLENVSHNCKK